MPEFASVTATYPDARAGSVVFPDRDRVSHVTCSAVSPGFYIHTREPPFLEEVPTGEVYAVDHMRIGSSL